MSEQSIKFPSYRELEEKVKSIQSKLKQAGLEIKGLRGTLEECQKILRNYRFTSTDGEDYNNDDVIDMDDNIQKILSTSPSTLSQEVEAQIREDEREMCCRLICSWCEEGVIPAKFRQYNGLSAWVHRNEKLGINNPCSAQVIRTGGVR